MWAVACLNSCSSFSPWGSAVSLGTLVLWLWARIAPPKEAAQQVCREHQTYSLTAFESAGGLCLKSNIENVFCI